MKKEYLNPEMEVLELKMQGFLCASKDIDENAPWDLNPGTAGDGDGF